MDTLRKLLPYLTRHWPYILTVVIAGLFMSATEALAPYLIKLLFDDVFAKRNAELAVLVPASFPVIYAIHGLARYIHMYKMKLLGELVITRIQKELQQKYMNLSLSHHAANSSGGLISKTLSDMTVIKDGISTFFELIREPITILAMIGYIIWIDWKTTLILLLVAPIIIIIVNVAAKSVRRNSHKQQEAMEAFTSNIKETVDGVRIIQSFNLSPHMQDRLAKVIDFYLGVRRRVIRGQESVGPINEFLIACVAGGLFYLKGQQILAGTATAGELMSYFAALGFVTQPIKRVQDGIMRIQPVIASCQRVFGTLESEEVVRESATPKPFPEDWKTIEYRNVSFSYGTERVLKNINVTIKRGEYLALVGESGSGKSTFVNLLERFYDPTEGEILIGGVPIRDIRLTELRRHIALVTQDVFLFNDSIAANIKSGNFENSSGSVESAARLANAHDFILKAPQGYDSLAGDRGGRLSGGEKQRISIARAIFKDAPILILDEATSALDSASEVEVQKGLDKLMVGRTAFVVAHRLSTVINADRILVFGKGEIVEEGSHQSLIAKRGAYFQFSQLQRLHD